MSIVYILMSGVGIRTANHIHLQAAASRHHFPKRIAVAQPFTAIVQRNLGRIKRNATSRAEACPIGMDAVEVVKPESRIVISWIILHKGKLSPAHRAVVPSCLVICDTAAAFAFANCE